MHFFFPFFLSHLSQEQWKSTSSTPASKRKDRSVLEDEEGGHGDRKRRRGGKRKRKDKRQRKRYEDEDGDMEDEPEEVNARENRGRENAQDHLLAAGLEDSDAEDDMVIFHLSPQKKNSVLFFFFFSKIPSLEIKYIIIFSFIANYYRGNAGGDDIINKSAEASVVGIRR